MCVLLAGCALPVPEVGDFVPVRQLLAETEGLPYQCIRLRPGQETCNLVSQLRRSGNGYTQKVQFAVDIGGASYMEVTERLEDRNGAACVLTEAFTTVTPGGGLLAEIDGTSPPAPPEEPLCYVYYRNPAGGYLAAELDAAGNLDRESLFPVEFLAERPRLQAIGLGF